ncbi:hypothetical protein CLV84_1994 [Neolewinella xylanilytica]|uniref:Outer membrane protein beta-barrel domain-containing protein n=1 Tax=Neolewinella xylanilytica TaxID=1514080 RepID=A0A2S6I1S9_9BACT|nr:hypothetical protein [Neolewinella xylanilytica]PPK85103.1 hypothetical protein CLV84_1994 [Neolewinella xylanilytica]
MLLLLTAAATQAQVKGVSYTIAPSASYNWFDAESGLDDAFMFGGRLGFGFGEFVELRATYLQTIDQQTNFAGLDLDIDSTFANQGVDLARYGAELKLNIGRGTLLPYLLLGGGIQSTEREGLEQAENIFGTLGLGLTLSAADRYTFGVEGKYIAYSGNTVRNLFDEVERQANNLDLDNFDSDQVGTYSVAANLQFYLGGRRPGQLSEIDQEYLENFQGGISGLSLPVEFGLAQVDWADELAYRDAYFAGGTAGFSFGPLISLRGFYYRGMTDDEINFDFDDISLYGGDFRFNLTQASSGIVPYLTVGGGYIDLASGYNDDLEEGQALASSQGFASGGGGIYLKFGERVTLNGGVRAMLTSGADLEDLNSTEQLTTSTMYTAGLGFTLGGNNLNDSPDVVRQSTLEDRLDQQQSEFDERAERIRLENQLELERLRNRYQDTIARLDEELLDALDAGDVRTAAVIKEEQEEARAIVREVEDRQDQLAVEGTQQEYRRDQVERAEVDAVLGRTPQLPQAAPNYRTTDESMILLQSEQIDRLIDALGQRGSTTASQPDQRSEQISEINRRIERMEDRMYDMRDYGGSRNEYNRSTDDMTAEERVRDLERRIESMRAPQSSGNATQPDNDALQERINSLERQLENRDTDIDEFDGDAEDRIEDLERRLMDRIDNVRDNDPRYREDMLRDLTDYQSEMMSEIRRLQNDLERANSENARLQRTQDIADERLDLERERLRQERRLARQSAREGEVTYTDSLGNSVTRPGVVGLEDISVNTGGVYLADDNAEGFFSGVTYTGMSGTANLFFGDATGLGLGLRWHYKLGPDQRAEFMPEAYFGIGSPTTFGIFGNLVYPIIPERSESTGLIPYAGIGLGAMQIQDDENSDETNFRPAINLLIGTYLPVGNGRFFVDYSTRNFFSVNQLTGGYRFNF